jgi:hypothetical protein
MPGHDDFDIHFVAALHDTFKIVDLEPQQNPISIGPVVTIADRAMIMFTLEAVQLKDELPVGNELLICGTSMVAHAAQQMLVPSAARFNIVHCDQRLRAHSSARNLAKPYFTAQLKFAASSVLPVPL